MLHNPRFLAGCVLVVVAAGCGERKSGQELGERLEVRSLRFEGVRSVSEWRLAELLETQRQSGAWRSEGTYFQREKFRKGLGRIVAFYNDLGYLDARIISFEVDRDMRRGTVDLRVVIDEGGL
jgi:outer membrane protein assembly factor BamA